MGRVLPLLLCTAACETRLVLVDPPPGSVDWASRSKSREAWRTPTFAFTAGVSLFGSP